MNSDAIYFQKNNESIFWLIAIAISLLLMAGCSSKEYDAYHPQDKLPKQRIEQINIYLMNIIEVKNGLPVMNFKEAGENRLKSIEKLSNEGSANAEIMLGMFDFKNLGRLKGGYEKYFHALERRALSGDADSQCLYWLIMGDDAFNFGARPVSQDKKKLSLIFLKEAANNGVPRCYSVYADGSESPSYSVRANYMLIAAEKGCGSCQMAMSLYYTFGHGVKPDKTKALYWARKATQSVDAVEYESHLKSFNFSNIF